MGSFSLVHWLVVIVLAMLLFGGRGKISGLMGDLAQGINSFKKGLADNDAPHVPPGYVPPPQYAPPPQGYAPQPVYPASQLAPPQPLATPQPGAPVRDDVPRS